MIGKQIEVPFRADMEEAVLAGRKRCTSRFERLGEAGDWFEIKGKKFVITRIVIGSVDFVARFLFKDEGFNSPEEFLKVWKEIHPRRTDLQLKVLVHFFERR